MKRSKGFTLIELLAVIVILAIIALIATPLVLKYIAKSREGANDASANSVLRAVENYYLTSKFNNKTSYPITLDLKNEEDVKKLGIKGKKPTDGVITINKKGDIYLEVVYGEIIYVKLPDETKITKNPMVIGDYNEWITDGNGTITKYVNSVEVQMENYFNYLATCIGYSTREEDNGAGYTFDYSKDLPENIALLEEQSDVSRKLLPNELNKEIDFLIELYDVEEAMTDEQSMELFNKNADKIPYSYNFANNGDGDMTKTTAYQLILNEIGIANSFVVPNYVKHEDGKLEKITSLAENSIASYNSGCPTNIRNKNLVIPYGIENIGASTFVGCLLNNVTFASTVKTIGDNAFEYNKFSSLVLPKSLQTIGEVAFNYNNIKGELVIPKNVTFIGYETFRSVTLTEDYCGNVYICEDMLGLKNEITNVIFEEGSKIETISQNAFLDNPMTSLTIPRSVKTIDNYAFNSSTLTSVTIKGTADHTISMGHTPFGSAKVEYIP